MLQEMVEGMEEYGKRKEYDADIYPPGPPPPSSKIAFQDNT